MKLAIVGAFGGTNLGSSFAHAAADLGLETVLFDMWDASRGSPILHGISWRLDRRPWRLNRFSNDLAKACSKTRPDVLLALGTAPLTLPTLKLLRNLGIFTIAYSADDPWNPAHRAAWYLRTLPLYDLVFTPRRANIEDFRKLGCADVRYLPFGYDDHLFGLKERQGEGEGPDVLFVGGADPDRVAFMNEYLRSGLSMNLVGAYWERYPAMRPLAMGSQSFESVLSLTLAAKMNLCLVRRANRDGHVMRSFEIAAAGGCLLAEDTPEHREIFGQDGAAALYFRTPQDAIRQSRVLLAEPAERERLRNAARRKVLEGAHTYRDRLKTMIAAMPHGKAESDRAMGTISP